VFYWGVLGGIDWFLEFLGCGWVVVCEGVWGGLLHIWGGVLFFRGGGCLLSGCLFCSPLPAEAGAGSRLLASAREGQGTSQKGERRSRPEQGRRERRTRSGQTYKKIRGTKAIATVEQF